MPRVALAALALQLALARAQPPPPPTPVLPPAPTEFCVADDGRNVSCGPATSQRCMPQPIWPRPIFHVMDFWCGENDPNGPYVSEHGMYHLFCELAYPHPLLVRLPLRFYLSLCSAAHSSS